MATGYRAIVKDIRHGIETGQYPAGSVIPSEAELATQYGVHRTTVQRALNLLREDGSVSSKRKGGTVVRPRVEPLDWYPGVFEHADHRRDTPGNGGDAWASDITARGRVPKQRVTVSVVNPTPLIAALLDVNPVGKTVVVRRRIRYVDNVPFQLADSYFPLDLADGTPIMDRGDVTIPGGLLAAIGHPQVRIRDTISCRMPTQTEVTRLVLPAGMPVIEHVRLGFDAADRPIRVMVTIHHDRIIYELGTV